MRDSPTVVPANAVSCPVLVATMGDACFICPCFIRQSQLWLCTMALARTDMPHTARQAVPAFLQKLYEYVSLFYQGCIHGE